MLLNPKFCLGTEVYIIDNIPRIVEIKCKHSNKWCKLCKGKRKIKLSVIEHFIQGPVKIRFYLVKKDKPLFYGISFCECCKDRFFSEKFIYLDLSKAKKDILILNKKSIKDAKNKLRKNSDIFNKLIKN